ncbi:hypothetical protein AZC_4347 [Azorhizobium caulinodans ORS 571]|uniref:Polyhydroxyalkanoic acid system protein n=1 Tax=Azorhizobium caulinodans (strain ATCC 43989 / DSM 5975 / JCM 20966 / LMG 6465 / NBRC 14845 / NCIMB 13405 / ORS 571) TaxID=438753 RepID=A8HVR1_AZOC5|nr:polyhydroxyalkanoic acid system family protein [Azorhizobium caulinodans]BAF90345.1 hypothetical protein AZC_4347 [Azorhizobium caulinodans ORS 571]
MAPPLTVSVPHKLGREEAVRRLQQGTSLLREKFGNQVQILEETWVDSNLDFRIAAMGQQASGKIEVADDQVNLAVELPYLLHLAGTKIKEMVQKQGALLLEKK